MAVRERARLDANALTTAPATVSTLAAVSPVQAATSRLFARCGNRASLLRRKRQAALWVASLFAGALAPLAPASATDGTPGDYYLDVSVNGAATGAIAHFIMRDGRLSAAADDLQSLGIDVSQLSISGDTQVPLDTIGGVQYRYDASRQSIDIAVPDALRVPFQIGRVTPRAANAMTSKGFVLNYDALVERDRMTRASSWTELRFFHPGGVFSQTGVFDTWPQSQTYLRYDTYWRHDNPIEMTTLQLGDTISGSLAWSRSVRLAGVQWRKNFALRPDLVTFPVPSLGGSAAVPSSVDVYLDGIRRFGGNVPAGPFVIREAPGLIGNLQASVVTRDALGRESVVNVPLYIDTRMLSAGLSSYSFEVGAPRADYGFRSWGYEHRVAASAAYRYGVSDLLTTEYHAEGSSGLANAGVGALVSLSGYGVLSGSLSGSTGRRNGGQFGIGYQYLSRNFSFDSLFQRTAGDFRDLATLGGSAVPTAMDRVTVSSPFWENRTLSLSYIGMRGPDFPTSRVISANVSWPVRSTGSLNVGAYRDMANRRSYGVFAMFSFTLGPNTVGSVSLARQQGATQALAGATHTPDYGGGWGWNVLGGVNDSVRIGQAQAQYLGRYGQASALAQTYDGQTRVGVGLTGALVAMDGGVYPARRIFDSFALVKTDADADVPVLREQLPVGRTNSGGSLVIPDLNGYQTNRLSVDTTDLPADMRIMPTARSVVPETGSGVLVSFPVHRYRAALITLVRPDGAPLQLGARVTHRETGAQMIVGYDGQTFIDGLLPENTLVVSQDNGACDVTFTYDPVAQGAMARIGPLVCTPEAIVAPPTLPRRAR
ncbi:fimbria/pilus outer membrane usher protein [Pandoraea sp. PE-S2R-1]|uniref:fimbria/pilus outer membrane usher protein n=1 Tax=Pandoraea sp. PE-S2R-1 TaxID=1986994 RepID=UPI001482B10D|nr:fimbria/pilus outer membrane usher protein [Pandoraea sp. PE-S2R-1]